MPEFGVCPKCEAEFTEVRFHIKVDGPGVFRRALMCKCDPDASVSVIEVDQFESMPFRMVKHSKPEGTGK